MDATPEKCGPYQPRELLATGASAQVWLADGPDGEVALKIARSEKHRTSLLREAETLGTAPHETLVTLLGAADDGAWLALERIEGVLMDEWATGKSPDAITAVALDLVEALEHLHGKGVIHGDLKPTNVIVDVHGRARLLDLGVATLPGEKATEFRGTLGFAAPELLRSETPTPATDLYGLGALLYTCLTGRTPFVAPDPAALTYLPLVSLPPPPSTFRRNLPATIDQLVLALLARDPARRPNNLGRVREALGRTLSRLAEPILGMLEEREELRRAVVGVADGEARVVVLYGPPGCGRRTLIGEAVEYARREGLPYVKGGDLKQALATIRAGKPSVMVHRAGHRGAQKLARLVLAEHLPCLLLLHAERPVPELAEAGAIELTPAPLSLKDVSTLASIHNVDPQNAERWWRETHGLPVAVLGKIRAERRRSRDAEFDPSDLPAEARKIYAAVQKAGTIDVADLAARLKLGQHALLDYCEVLFAEGVLHSARDGAALTLEESA